MLPEHLVYDVVRVRIDRSHGDVAFRLASAQGVCTKQNNVADFDGALAELAKQHGAPITNQDHLDAVVRHRSNRTMDCRGPSKNWREPREPPVPLITFHFVIHMGFTRRRLRCPSWQGVTQR